MPFCYTFFHMSFCVLEKKNNPLLIRSFFDLKNY